MPPSDLQQAIEGTHRQTALLDSNLVLLQVSAAFGPEMLASFKRVRMFAWQDALLLNWLLSRFASIATTAYVLTEVSNLANELSGSARDKWFAELGKFGTTTDEKHVPTKTVSAQRELIPFGMADSALTVLSLEHTVITAEWRLSGYLEANGRRVINFNHLRPLWISHV